MAYGCEDQVRETTARMTIRTVARVITRAAGCEKGEGTMKVVPSLIVHSHMTSVFLG